MPVSTDAIAYPEDGSVRPVTRVVWSPVPVAPPPEQPSEALAGKRIVILGGGEETAARIAATLRKHGAGVHRYTPAGVGLVDDAAAFTARYGPLDGIIDLNLETPFHVDGADAWQRPLQQSVALLKACYADWVEETDSRRLFYLAVTRLGGRMGFAGDACRQPLGGLWAGFAKTLPIEIPNCNVRVLDLSPPDEENIQDIIARELYRWGWFEIGYAHGVRHTLVPQRAELDAFPVSLGPDDTILVSGGSRGIGFALARNLAMDAGCRVIVTGRTPLPRGDEPWLVMDDATFQRYRKDLYRRTGSDGSLVSVRRSAERIARQRELALHLQEARSAGLRLEYRVCDF
ncbi:MAG: cytochrome, partial [Chloroflexi bacterium]|nr:cytochrome [Chloroflexota bacterium]